MSTFAEYTFAMDKCSVGGLTLILSNVHLPDEPEGVLHRDLLHTHTCPWFGLLYRGLARLPSERS